VEAILTTENSVDVSGGRKAAKSERSPFALQNSATSNLNTSFDAYLTLRLIVIVGRMVG
jgi:hypothetical protein